jgi:uncharacterized DUF497 family protein
MYGVAFEWDPKKESANSGKHGVGFAERAPSSVTRFRSRFSTQTIQRIRLISTRVATKRERRNYEETFS